MADKRKRRRLGAYLLSYDMNLIVAVIFLIVFGLIMIYSSSYYTASMSQAYNYDPTFLLKSQAKYSVLGVAAMLVVANIDYHKWRYFAMLGLIGSVILILLLLVPGLGVTVKGATRWIMVPGIGQFQVAEPVKVGMIVFSAALICKHAHSLGNWKVLFRVMAPTIVIAAMILKISNNMSTAVIVFGISFLMVFMVHPKYYPFLIMGLVGVVVAAGVIYYTLHMPETDSDSPFRIARIVAWLKPYEYESDKAYQSLQGIYAIGSGGLMGKGLGNSIQKLRIPEPYNDMIFAIICEELGLFGGIAVIIMFLMLIWRLMIIANNAPDLYGALLVVGVMGHIAVQVILNIAVVTNTIPNTGISLPFISYGGSSVMFLLIEIGITLSVAKGIRLKDL